MKRLMLLIAILTMNCKSFSQTVTLNKHQAKETVKDLIKGDLCQEENKNLLEQNNILSNQVEQKSDEVENLEEQVKKTESVVFKKDKIIDEKDSVILANEKIIKKKENVSLLYKIGTGVGIVLAIIFAVK